ncbi:ABC transporter permease [uncultured Psychromonas sp.]|uniref:ABC transporter permease n=1 Tax=uncultured Psychromonas sp. TaxID=173974 RepID=UPI00260A1A6A|nr:ABC transporter permease [uncultured Psychromonas sp.]
MQTSIDISWLQLGLFSLLLFIPITINAYFKLSINKSTFIALVRLVLQLLLVGLYLEYIFKLDSILLNTGWLIIMITVGSYSIITKSGLNNRYLFIANSIALSCAVLPILLVLSLFIIQPTPWYSTQYMIPLAGMLLGNSLSANIVALQNLFNAFNQQQDEYEGALALGASPYQAAFPFLQQSLKKAQAPILATIATTGIVSLPGMMTGQILGGVTPMVAIKYQLLIFIAMLIMLSISLTISLLLTLKISLAKNGLIKIKVNN